MSFEQFPLPVPQWRDLLEILIVAFVIYRLLLVLVGTRALQIVFGLLVLAAIYFAALLLKLTMITYLLGVVFTYGDRGPGGVSARLRHALARLGQTRVFRLFGGRSGPRWRGDRQGDERLSRSATGAIIAVEQGVRLDEYLDTGTPMNATVSAELLATIFSPYSPLHDGAVIVRGNVIVGAGTILPLTRIASQRPDAGDTASCGPRTVGGDRRPRAGRLGGAAAVSLARRGRLVRDLTPEQVRATLCPPTS